MNLFQVKKKRYKALLWYPFSVAICIQNWAECSFPATSLSYEHFAFIDTPAGLE